MKKAERAKAIALEIHATFANVGKGITSSYMAQQSASACVDWILNATTGDKEAQTFWRKVKTEIKNLYS